MRTRELAKPATNYFAVAHPSLTNYLEVVGGSNFGVLDDNSPDWHNGACLPNLVTGTTSTDNPASPPSVRSALGTDAATPPSISRMRPRDLREPSISTVSNRYAANPEHRGQDHRRPIRAAAEDLEELSGEPAGRGRGRHRLQ